MTLVPDFEPGLWNAWIVLAAYVTTMLPMSMGAGARTAEARMAGEPKLSTLGTRARVGAVAAHAVMPAGVVYSVFVPLESGTWWLYAGLAVSAAGIVMALAVSLAFARAPLDEPMTAGAYAFSRNPMYVAGFLVFVGAGLAGTSWVLLGCALIWIGGMGFAVPEEEEILVAKYGAAYERYMERTPRWFGFPGARRPAGTS